MSTKPIPRLSACVLPRLAQQTIDGVVLGLQALIDPHLHARTLRLIILVVATAQLDRDGQGLDVYHDTPDPIGEQVAEFTHTVRIGDGDIHQGIQRLTHGIPHQRGTASLGFEQVPKRRLLLSMFVGAKTRTLRKIDDGHR